MGTRSALQALCVENPSITRVVSKSCKTWHNYTKYLLINISKNNLWANKTDVSCTILRHIVHQLKTDNRIVLIMCYGLVKFRYACCQRRQHCMPYTYTYVYGYICVCACVYVCVCVYVFHFSFQPSVCFIHFLVPMISLKAITAMESVICWYTLCYIPIPLYFVQNRLSLWYDWCLSCDYIYFELVFYSCVFVTLGSEKYHLVSMRYWTMSGQGEYAYQHITGDTYSDYGMDT